MCGAGPLQQVSFAQKASVPKQPHKAAIATENLKELLALMDTDTNGKISPQEWMKFMKAEFVEPLRPEGRSFTPLPR
jgi:hypothetical protein